MATKALPVTRLSHPFLKGLGITLLLSFAYAFVFLSSTASWMILEFSFFPVVLVANVGGMALHIRGQYGNLEGLGRYVGGVVTVVVLDIALFIFSLLLLFAVFAASGGQ